MSDLRDLNAAYHPDGRLRDAATRERWELGLLRQAAEQWAEAQRLNALRKDLENQRIALRVGWALLGGIVLMALLILQATLPR